MKITIDQLRTIIREVNLSERPDPSWNRPRKTAQDIKSLLAAANEAYRLAPEKSEIYAVFDNRSPKSSQIKPLLKQCSDIVEKWTALRDAIEATETDDPKLNKVLYSADGIIDEYTSFADDLEVEFEKASIVDKKMSSLKRSGIKEITIDDIARIYKAAKSEYSSSYAMMIDDAMKGANSVAKKLGLSVVTDWGWFPVMFRYVRAHKQWDSIPADTKMDMVDFANEELSKYAKSMGRGRR